MSDRGRTVPIKKNVSTTKNVSNKNASNKKKDVTIKNKIVPSIKTNNKYDVLEQSPTKSESLSDEQSSSHLKPGPTGNKGEEKLRELEEQNKYYKRILPDKIVKSYFSEEKVKESLAEKLDAYAVFNDDTLKNIKLTGKCINNVMLNKKMNEFLVKTRDEVEREKDQHIQYTPKLLLDKAHEHMNSKPMDAVQAAEKIYFSYSCAMKFCYQKIGVLFNDHKILRILSSLADRVLSEPIIFDSYEYASKAHDYAFKYGHLPELEDCYYSVNKFIKIYNNLDFSPVKTRLDELIGKGSNDKEYIKYLGELKIKEFECKEWIFGNYLDFKRIVEYPKKT